jgi:membrane protein DedA with SNARE-associated domain
MSNRIRDYLVIKVFPFLGDLFSFDEWPYVKLFVLIMAEEAGIPLPVPGDALLAIFGYKAKLGNIGLLETLMTVTIATFIGASILYGLGWRFGRPMVERFGKYIHVSHHDIERTEKWMNKYGVWILMVTRMTPGLRVASTLAAGVLHFSYRKFIAATLIATWIWVGIYFYLGVFLGKRYGELIDSILQHHWLVVSFVLGSFIGWILFLMFAAPRLRRWRRQHPPNAT